MPVLFDLEERAAGALARAAVRLVERLLRCCAAHARIDLVQEHEREVPAKRADESDERFNDRYAKWQEHGEKIHNVAESIIAKQRHGPIGSVRLFFDGAFTKFDNFADAGQYSDVAD